MNSTNIICNSYFEYSSGILNVVLLIVTIAEIVLGYSNCCKSNTVIQLPAEIFKKIDSQNRLCQAIEHADAEEV